MSILEKLGYGGQVMLIGLVIVFAVLILLICIITALSAAVRASEGKGKKQAAPAPAPAAAPVEVPAETEEVAVEDNTELIAVIAAALAAYDNSNKLVVRSVRKVSGWKNANRSEQVYHF